ncbi:ULP PROTEASE domain-containing protein [Aphis craccivora]|uniref:ULP PROTEASE domain-containing protein n=1 Tax=Aphis craccivora TaxID=307492 RepID=A0A6G0VNS6_APHCR|nr:ULP PROTEASE domain-containing protein [Aphis craccivora]
MTQQGSVGVGAGGGRGGIRHVRVGAGGGGVVRLKAQGLRHQNCPFHTTDEKIKVSNNNIILMPWRVNDNHWILIVINVETKMFTITNPLNTNERIKMIRFLRSA